MSWETLRTLLSGTAFCKSAGYSEDANAEPVWRSLEGARDGVGDFPSSRVSG